MKYFEPAEWFILSFAFLIAIIVSVAFIVDGAI